MDPLGILPKKPSLEGFAPLPSASANEFMSMQGAQMALYFGAYYTIGKRMIALLDNEDFNAMVKTPKLFSDYLNRHSDQIIKNFDTRMEKSMPSIQEQIIKAGEKLEHKKLDMNYDLMVYFMKFLGDKGLKGVELVANMLGIDIEDAKKMIVGNDNVNVNVGTSAQSQNKTTGGNFGETLQDTYSKTGRTTQQNTAVKTHVLSTQAVVWKIKASYGSYYRVIRSTNPKDLSLNDTALGMYNTIQARHQDVLSHGHWLRKSGNMGQSDARKVVAAKNAYEIWHALVSGFRRKFGIMPTKAYLDDIKRL
jgi:hypothetical protein